MLIALPTSGFMAPSQTALPSTTYAALLTASTLTTLRSSAIAPIFFEAIAHHRNMLVAHIVPTGICTIYSTHIFAQTMVHEDAVPANTNGRARGELHHGRAENESIQVRPVP